MDGVLTLALIYIIGESRVIKERGMHRQHLLQKYLRKIVLAVFS